MTWMDHGLAVICGLVLPLWSYFDYGRFKARVRAGVPGARLAAYAEGSIVLWLLVAAAAALWIRLDRDWAWLGLRAPDSRDGWLALGAAALVGGYLLAQSAVVARQPATHERVRGKLSRLVEMLPIDRSDLSGFIALSVTAGVCEEILFRGVLGWYFGNWLGEWGGQAAAMVLFGAAHLYQGAAGALGATVVGAVAAGLYLWCDSLVPSMLLHAAIDLSSGWMAYEVLREPRPCSSP